MKHAINVTLRINVECEADLESAINATDRALAMTKHTAEGYIADSFKGASVHVAKRHIAPAKLAVRIEYDSSCDDPSPTKDGCSGWRLISFGRRHLNYQDPCKVGLRYATGGPSSYEVEDEGLRADLEAGRAFLLSYYEHGNCLWSLREEGPDCRWDSVRTAGLLVWEGDAPCPYTSHEKASESARAFLESYTAWANGECYGYSIEDDGEHVDSCWGYYGNDADLMVEEIKSAIDGRPFEVTGDAAHLLEGSN
jgi:hypothetical protein